MIGLGRSHAHAVTWPPGKPAWGGSLQSAIVGRHLARRTPAAKRPEAEADAVGLCRALAGGRLLGGGAGDASGHLLCKGLKAVRWHFVNQKCCLLLLGQRRGAPVLGFRCNLL